MRSKKAALHSFFNIGVPGYYAEQEGGAYLFPLFALFAFAVKILRSPAVSGEFFILVLALFAGRW
jgi:hypothetical protein